MNFSVVSIRRVCVPVSKKLDSAFGASTFDIFFHGLKFKDRLLLTPAAQEAGSVGCYKIEREIVVCFVVTGLSLTMIYSILTIRQATI